MTSTYDGLVQKQVFEMEAPYRTVGGATIDDLRVGYETIGTLNEARDNAILIPHYNSGNSHFAGRYRREDLLPGYWDAIVGPGKPLDTDKYCLIGVDSLCNANANDGVTVTTGPSSIDLRTGKPYGMRFPQVQIRDFVNVQKALMDRLGIRKLHAVMGASMGSMQTFEWAVAYPQMVERVIGVIPAAFVDDYSALRLYELRRMIMLDPNWKGGDYYGGPAPREGLAMAIRQMMLMSLAPEWGEEAFARKWADPEKDPAADMANGFASAAWMDAAVNMRVDLCDANNFMYIQRANELFTLDGKGSLEEGVGNLRARTLLLPAANDQILFPQYARKLRDLLQAQGTPVEYHELQGAMGHLNGVFAIAQAGDIISRFLAH